MNSPEHPVVEPANPSRRWLWFGLKWLLFAAVLYFVGRRGWQLWHEQGDFSAVRVNVLWLLLAGGMYGVGWLPSVWFWRELMLRLGGQVTFRDAARAYFCGHLGKYIPGKAMVLIIRSALAKNQATTAATAAVTAIVETLLMMGTGLAVGVALAPMLLSEALMRGWPDWIQKYAMRPGVTASLVLALLLISLPLLARVLTLVAVRMTPSTFRDDTATVRISPRLVAVGIAAFALSWGFHGLSLGLTLRAVSSVPFDLAMWPVWTGAVAAATAVGFAVLIAPGGMGVREGLIVEFLRVQPGIESQQAVVAAVFLRIVWFATEIGMAAVLYFTFVPSKKNIEPTDIADIGA